MTGRKRISLHDRFFEKVEPVTESGCWIWVGSRNRCGYGQFMLRGRPHLAHRVSWELKCGKCPDGAVLHKCDTPSCVNPSHLFIGSQADNVADMMAKGRNVVGIRHSADRHGRARISNETAIQIFNAQGRHAEIASHFGVCNATVSHIKTGRQWSSITGKNRK